MAIFYHALPLWAGGRIKQIYITQAGSLMLNSSIWFDALQCDAFD
jgi:hypothetical protein